MNLVLFPKTKIISVFHQALCWFDTARVDAKYSSPSRIALMSSLTFVSGEALMANAVSRVTASIAMRAAAPSWHAS